MDEYYSNVPSRYYEEDGEIYQETFYQTFNYCMKPTIHEIIPYIWKMLLCNLIFRIIVKLSVIPTGLGHIFSSIIGICLLFLLMQNSLLYIAIYIIFCFFTLKIFYWLCAKIYIYVVGILYLIYLIGSELYFPVPSIWMETRGVHMVIAMKFISLMFDVQSKTIKQMPSIIAIGGYILCPSNCILGPWISYPSYCSFFEHRTGLLNFSWLKQSTFFMIVSLLFLMLSNCWATWIIPQTLKWSVTYQEALSFRSSHYFISFLSGAMLIIGGLGHDEHKKDTDFQPYYITKPLYIELPRSLVQVVVYWNIPMHMWLKKYVFRASKPLGNFTAVILTYFVSSFLHGFNLKLAAVLLSLGFYTYVEYEFRNKISYIFDACIKANACKKCTHKYRNHHYVQITNITFSGLAIFHLAYLGCLMESLAVNWENEENIFEKWSELGYFSHIIITSIYFFHKFI